MRNTLRSIDIDLHKSPLLLVDSFLKFVICDDVKLFRVV